MLGAGDFCNMRTGLGEAMALLADLRAPLVAVPGNAESDVELRSAAPQVTVLHGAGCTIAGLHLFGLGGGVPVTPFGSWSFDLTEARAAEMLDRCAQADILLTHAPPKGVADVTSAGQSVGSTAIAAAIARLSPRLALCGHIHDSWGRRGRIGVTDVVNLGPGATFFEIET